MKLIAKTTAKTVQDVWKETKTCPKCGRRYVGYPATSRRDNKTEICPECGTREALLVFGLSKDAVERLITDMHGQYEDLYVEDHEADRNKDGFCMSDRETVT